MERVNYSDTAHNLNCNYRFNCKEVRCPGTVGKSKPPSCFIEKFQRYQPEYETVWYEKTWKEVNRITWREVFSLEESWIYILITITVIVFLFMVIILIKILSEIN